MVVLQDIFTLFTRPNLKVHFSWTSSPSCTKGRTSILRFHSFTSDLKAATRTHERAASNVVVWRDSPLTRSRKPVRKLSCTLLHFELSHLLGGHMHRRRLRQMCKQLQGGVIGNVVDFFLKAFAQQRHQQQGRQTDS